MAARCCAAGGGLYYNSSLSIATDILNGGPLGTTSFTSEIYSPFSSELTYGFLPDLQLPSVAQWNATLERAWSAHDVLSLGYLGSDGRSLLRREVGGPGSTSTYFAALTTNRGYSDYHALALQYRRTLAAGGAGDGRVHVVALDRQRVERRVSGVGQRRVRWIADGPTSICGRRSTRPSASSPRGSAAGRSTAWHRARSGFPLSPLQSEQYVGISLSNAFRPAMALSQPVRIADANSPGGRRLNPLAFLPTKTAVQGGLGRNAFEGFGMWQLDLAVRREFRLSEHRRVQLRVEAFNALNHPGFADPVRYLNNPLFGQPASMLNQMLGTGSPGSGLAPLLQSGGPRSLQLSLRFQF